MAGLTASVDWKACRRILIRLTRSSATLAGTFWRKLRTASPHGFHPGQPATARCQATGPPAFGSGADMAQSSAYLGREVDITGFYNLGHRIYDPISGRWLSYDPAWNANDPNGFSYCGDNPVNYFDPSGLCLEAGWNGTKYYGGMAVRTVAGMAEDINSMDAMVDPVNPQYLQVHMQMARQGMIDYANGGQGWSGTRNVINRVNPLRAPFEAVSGEHLMEGPQLGDRLTGAERATQWAAQSVWRRVWEPAPRHHERRFC